MALSWLITGGCGFIGTSLIARLLKEEPDTRIRVLDNLTVGTYEDLGEVAATIRKVTSSIQGPPEGMEVVEGDVRDYAACVKSCTGIDIVVHLAANTGVAPSVDDPRLDMESNVIGTFNMLESCRAKGVGRFIFASSGAPIGETEPPIHEEKAPRPVSPYGASKLAGEAYCSAYNKTFGIKTVALRFGNVYGPRSKHKNSVVAKFIKRALQGEPLEIYGDGNQTRDFIHIHDLVDAIILASLTDAGGEVFQIATYRETTVNEIADSIKEIIERKTAQKVMVVHSNSRLGDVKRSYSDISKAKCVLGFNPKFDLRRGLEDTISYFVADRL